MPSSNIDKRIVEMDFDNARFERNCNQSISTLDKLKNALNLGDTAKGFNALEKQANSIDFSGLERSISNIEKRFSTLGIISATVVSNITNRVVNSVNNISHTIFGLAKTGGINRALNLEHANFMLNGILKDASKVSEIISGPVNNAVSGTAYGLDAAANAAAQLVASGVTDMQKLENALTGISGAAAMTGSSYEDIARIFTTVAGNGRLMGDQLLQFSGRGLNIASELAKSLGKTEAEIRDMVSKGKIDFETFATVMNDAFGDQAKKANETFTGAMSNVKAALSRIGAKIATPALENIRKIFVDLITVINNTSKTLQPFIDFVNNGIDSVTNKIRGVLTQTERLDSIVSNIVSGMGESIKVIYSFILPIKRALDDIIPKKTLDDTIALTAAISGIISTLKLSEDQMITVTRIFRGLFAVADILLNLVSSIVQAIFPATSGLKGLAGGILEVLATIGDYIYAVDLVIKKNNIFGELFGLVADKVKNLATFIINSVREIKVFVSPFLDYISDGINNLVSSINNLEGSVNILDKIKERFKGLTSIGKVLSAIFDGLKAVFKEVSPIFKAFADYVSNGIATLFTGIAEAVRSGRGFEGFLDLINTVLLGGIGAGIVKFINQIVNITKKSNTLIRNVSWVFKELANSLSVFQAKVKTDMLASIAKSVGILTLSIIGLSLIDSDKLMKALAAITILMGVLVGARIALSKFIPVAEAAGTAWYQKIMNPFSQALQIGAQSDALLKLAAAIGILAVSLKLISTIKGDDMNAALGGFIVLVGGFIGSAIVLDKYTEQLPEIANSFIALSLSMFILAKGLEGLSKQDPIGVAAGVGALVVMLAAIGAALNNIKAPKGGDLAATAGAISMIALAIGSLAPGLALLALMDPVKLLTGLTALAGMLGAIYLALTNIEGSSDLMWTAGAISMIALAIGSLAPGLALLALMDPVKLLTGLTALAGMLGAIYLALTNIEGSSDLMWTAGAISMIALALNTLAPTITLLGALPWQTLVQGLLGLAGALAIIGGAAFLLKKFELGPALIIMGESLLMISGSVLLVGAGLLMIATSLGIIGVSGVTAAAGITAIMVAIGSALPNLFTGLALGITAFIVALGSMAGAIATALGQIIGSISMAVANGIRMSIPSWIKCVQEVTTALLNAINELVPLLINVVLNVVESLLTALNEHAETIILGLIELHITIINGLATAIEQYAEPMSDAWIHLFEVVFNTLIGEILPKFLDFGLDILGAILKGIIQAAGELINTLVDIGGQMLKALGVPEDWVDAATNFVKGLINGLTNGLTDLVDKAKELGKSMLSGIKEVLKIHSPSEEGDDIGGYFDQGIINGIKRLKGDVVASVADVGQGMKDQATIDANSVMSIWGSVTNGKKSLTNSEKKAAANDLSANSAIQEKLNAKKRESTKVTEESTNALLNEASALSSNSKATGSSTKAKEENAVANETKTAAIDDESESLNEETEAVDDNRQAILEQAEAIEVITEKFDELINYQRYNDGFKTVKKLTKAFSSFWSNGLDGGFTKKSDVNKSFNKLSETLNKTTKYAKKGVYAFNENGKYLKKLSAAYDKNCKKIEKQVLKTGKTLIKVTDGQAKIFEKTGSGLEKYTIRVTKNIKNMGKQIAKAKTVMSDFANMNIPEFVLNTDNAETFINKLRDIQDIFVKKSSMPKQVQDFLGTINFKMAEVSESMNILGKNIDNVGNYMSKKSQSTAYVQDAFISLAATLYDGSDAANEYATEHAKLLFLLENGEATEDEVAAHFESYIKRITDCLVEYRNSIEENLRGSFDVWTEFDKNLLDENEDLISNIESQIAGVTQWSAMLMELSKRGMDMNILKVLTDEGTASYGKLKKLLSMTSDELALFTQRYKQSETAITTARDTALAALANATARASQRAASKSGKISLAQLKVSKKAAKEMIDDAKAVADNQARYNSLTKKEEKKYLASLTVEEQKAYKKRLKAQKKALRAEKKAAAREEVKRAEESRVSGILDGIKSMNDYLVVMKKYYDDSNVINKLNEQVAEAFKDISGAVAETTVYTDSANNAILRFAESLDDTGTDGLNYFEELIARVQKFMDEIKSAITNVNLLTTAFGTAESTSIQKIYENALSNVIGDSQVSSLMDALKSKGYSTEVMEDVISTWKSDRAAGVELMKALASADEEYVKKINAAYDKESELATALADKAVGTMASTTSKAGLESNLEVAKQQITDATNAYNTATANLKNAQDKLSSKNTELSKINRLNKLLNKDQSKLTNKEKKELKSLKKAYADFAKKSSTQRTNYITTLKQEITTLQNDITTYSHEVSDASADVTAATKEQSKAQAELNEYLEKMNRYYNQLINDAKLKDWFNNTATSVSELAKAMDSLDSSSDKFIYAKGKISEVLEEFSDAINIYNDSDSFVNIKGITGMSESISNIEEGLLSFGETLIDVTEDSDDFWESLKKGLADYQAQLKSTIASSSDFFSMFSGFADEDNPLTATNYLEYADSQIEALNTWQENLKKLADMGLNKEILEKFAAQGLSSYEQVNAWVNATTQQIGEYNKQWEDYNNLVESAANSAMAAIGAAWSKAGQSLQDSMISSFLSNGSDRLTEAGYEASAMIISGVENGLTNAMPELISAVEKTSTSSIATAVGKTVGTAINQGLVTSITASVTDTVNAAIEKFKMAVDSVNSYITDTLDTDYTITIHVDTSEMDAAIARMNEAVRRTNTVANTTSQTVSDSAANQQTVNNTSETTQVVNNVTYEQTINSPTAMNQVEIYRESQAVANQIKSTLALANG